MHVDNLLQVTVKKDILHIQLMDRPMSRYRNTENSAYSGWFDNRAKYLVTINSGLLDFFR